MKKYIITQLILLCSVLSAVSQQQSITFTIDQVIEMALKENFDIRVARINSEIAQNNNTLGNAGFMPLVTATSLYDVSIQNTEQEFINGTSQEVDGARRENFNIGADGTWTLFDGTRMFVAKNRLQNQAVQQYMAYKLEVDNRMAEVMRLFYLTAFEMERRALFESNLEFSRERVRIAEQTYEIGKASKLELLQAKVDFNTDQTSLIQQQELLASQKLALLRAIGKDLEADFSVNYVMEIDSTLELNDLISKALAQNPAILVQQYSYTIAQQQAEELEKSRYPVINLNAGYSFSNLNSEAGFLLRNQSAGFNYGLSARVNVFDGFNQKRLIQNARLQAESSQIAIDNSINLITTTLKTSYNSYQNNLYLRKIEAENLDVALENADIALERFKIGVSSSLQLREAQVNAVNAQIRYLQASFLAKQAEIELKRLSGMLSVIED